MRTDRFDKNAKIQNMSTKASLHDLCRLAKHQNFFYTPPGAWHGKNYGWRGRKIFLATQKNMAFITKPLYSNKILQICKNNSVFILFIQNKAISLQRNSKKQPLAVSHWPLAKLRNTNQKQNIKHNAQIKSAQPSNMTHKDKASDKTRSRRQIAADFQVRGNKREEEMASVKTRNGNVSGDLKVPRY